MKRQINKLIKEATKGKEHIKFTIGVLNEGKTCYKWFDSHGEIPYASYYLSWKYKTGR